jgi:hypothetical protein
MGSHADWLSARMDFDHVIMVDANGRVTDGPRDVHAPESLIGTDADGQILAAHEREWIDSITRQGWELRTYGYSSQYRYSGPIMHASEYIGGSLAENIVRQPSLYAAITVETLDDGEDAAGWAVAYRLVPFRKGGSFRCPCCGDDTPTGDGTELVCDKCAEAGCESSWDAGGELGFWSCDRPDTDDAENENGDK